MVSSCRLWFGQLVGHLELICLVLLAVVCRRLLSLTTASGDFEVMSFAPTIITTTYKLKNNCYLWSISHLIWNKWNIEGKCRPVLKLAPLKSIESRSKCEIGRTMQTNGIQRKNADQYRQNADRQSERVIYWGCFSNILIKTWLFLIRCLKQKHCKKWRNYLQYYISYIISFFYISCFI